MSIFSRNTQATAADPSDRAARTLYAGAEAETITDAFPDLYAPTAATLQTLLFYTRVAIIVGWLRRVENAVNDPKWTKLLVAFEKLVFPGLPVSLPVLILIRQLDAVLYRAQEMNNGNPTPSLRDSPILTQQWFNDWLGLVFDAPDIEAIGPARRLHLSLQIIDETQFLARAIADLGKDL